MSHFTTC